MISAEVIRRYPFFSGLDDEYIKSIAMITEETPLTSGEIVFEAGKSKKKLYLLVEGNIESSIVVEDSNYPAYHKEFYLANINPGEVFGLNAMLEPYVYSTTARASRAGKVLSIDAAALIRLCETDCKLGYQVMQKVAETALDRLYNTRIELAAAR